MLFLALFLILFSGCESNRVIISDVDEREANEIVVFLASKSIPAEKISHAGTSPGGDTNVIRFSIAVSDDKATLAMAYLNQNGLPRVQGTSLLTLFAKQGLMSSQQEDQIRYQAGLAEQIANTIRLIDGVIDAQVQIAFPSTETTTAIPGTAAPQKTTAAIYVKHQGVLDDVNSHIVTKIKRLVASSVPNLDINDVTVITDRARFMDISLNQIPETLNGTMPGELVSIWSIVMSKASAAKFRTLFFGLLLLCFVFAVIAGWLIWKIYPILRQKGGWKELMQSAPLNSGEKALSGPESQEETF